MMVPDLDEMRQTVGNLRMTDAQMKEEIAKLGHSIGLRSIWAFRNGEGHPAWKTVQAFSALIAKHSRKEREAKQDDEKLNKSAA